MKVAAVGFTCMDVYENLNNRFYATGNGVDCLMNLCTHPEIKGSVVTAVGSDGYGKFMLKILKEKGLDTSHVHVVQDGKTAVIKMSLNGRDRVHGERIRGVMEHYDLFEGDLEFIQQQDIIHTDLSWRVTPKLPKMCRKGTNIFFDFSVRFQHPEVPDILKNISWGMFSFEKRTREVERFLEDGCALGPKVLLATFGREGAIAYDGKRLYEQGIIEDHGVVNTAGAGDAFAAGFLYGMIRDEGVKRALFYGAETAAKVVSLFEPYPV